jgi:hypothetical protein
MTDSLRRFAPASYCTAALLVLLPMMDYLGSAWPFRPSAADWRYEVAGTISTHLLSPLLGLLLASATAAALPQRRVSKALGVLVSVVAVVLLLVLGNFVLDSLQVRNVAPPNARWVSRTSFLLAAAKILAGALTLMVLGVGNRRAVKAVVPTAATRPGPAAIIGQRAGS